MPARNQTRTLVPDIIPMAGVALILVLILMATAKDLLTHEGTPVDVPPANTTDRQPEENITVALSMKSPEEYELYYNDTLVASIDQLERQVANALIREPYILVVVRADKQAPSQWVMDILAMAKRSGAQRVAISTKKPPEKKAAEGKERR